jgi:heme/copper-type cytochrome/quinol oxidase subunit 2
MLAAPVLLVLSYRRSLMNSKTAKWALTIARYPLYMGAVLALANNSMNTAGALFNAKQETLQFTYLLVVTVLAVMMLIALGIGLVRTLIPLCRNKETHGETRTSIIDTPPVNSSVKLESTITYMVIAVIAAVILRGLTKRK